MDLTKINRASSSDIFLTLYPYIDPLTKWEMGQSEGKEVIKVQSWSCGPRSQDIVES